MQQKISLLKSSAENVDEILAATSHRLPFTGCSSVRFPIENDLARRAVWSYTHSEFHQTLISGCGSP